VRHCHQRNLPECLVGFPVFYLFHFIHLSLLAFIPFLLTNLPTALLAAVWKHVRLSLRGHLSLQPSKFLPTNSMQLIPLIPRPIRLILNPHLIQGGISMSLCRHYWIAMQFRLRIFRNSRLSNLILKSTNPPLRHNKPNQPHQQRNSNNSCCYPNSNFCSCAETTMDIGYKRWSYCRRCRTFARRAAG
jgi:hypothetical protein